MSDEVKGCPLTREDGKTKVCIVGLGPAGMGAALRLSEDNKSIDLVCLDAGNPPEKRLCSKRSNQVCDEEEYCQVICGFGGCAYLSGGKVSDFPAGGGLASLIGSPEKTKKTLAQGLHELSCYVDLRRTNPNAAIIENERAFFERLGFEYKYYASYYCTHQRLAEGVKKIYEQLESKRIAMLFKRELVMVRRDREGFLLTVKHMDKRSEVYADCLILAVGRSGRDLLREVGHSLSLSGKENHLDIGVRLEFPTRLFTEKVKAHNDLKLVFGTARTFCVCKDGQVVRYFSNGFQLTEGRCTSGRKTGLTNLGITVRLPPANENVDLLNMLKEQMIRLKKGVVIHQGLDSYLNNGFNSTKLSTGQASDINAVLPISVSGSVREAVHYFASRFFSKRDWKYVTVFAPEIDFGGVAFPINDDFSIAPNLYLVGDCTGRFRGILQAWSSGMSCAQRILGEDHETNKTA